MTSSCRRCRSVLIPRFRGVCAKCVYDRLWEIEPVFFGHSDERITTRITADLEREALFAVSDAARDLLAAEDPRLFADRVKRLRERIKRVDDLGLLRSRRR